MDSNTIQFAVNGNTESVRLTEKGCGYDAFAVKGVRWFKRVTETPTTKPTSPA